MSYVRDDGTVVAEYAYDPFGGTISETGPMAGAFRHGFSTKSFDRETSLYYYGYRFYSPSLGRWLNRDPLEEISCCNVYSYVKNATFHMFDCLGLSFTDRLGAAAYAAYSNSLIGKIFGDGLDVRSESEVNEIKEQIASLRDFCGDVPVASLEYCYAQHKLNDRLAEILFKHYLFGAGEDFELTSDEMTHVMQNLNPKFGLRYGNCPDKCVNNKCKYAKTEVTFNSDKAWVYAPATLGNFLLRYEGMLCTKGECPRSWTGLVWVDRDPKEMYDFDPDWKHSAAGGKRGTLQEVKTRQVYMMGIGRDFQIYGPKVLHQIIWDENGRIKQ